MATPTQNDFNALSSMTLDDRAAILYSYTCIKGLSMVDIADNSYLDPRQVSMVTRCYGFGGRNNGIFANMDVELEDVQAFVKSYPNGCNYDGKGTVMYQFLQKRLSQRAKLSSTTNMFDHYTLPKDDQKRIEDVQLNVNDDTSDGDSKGVGIFLLLWFVVTIAIKVVKGIGWLFAALKGGAIAIALMLIIIIIIRVLRKNT